MTPEQEYQLYLMGRALMHRKAKKYSPLWFLTHANSDSLLFTFILISWMYYLWFYDTYRFIKQKIFRIK